MQNFHLSSIFEQQIPSSSQSWVISALKQDPIIWTSLLNPAFLNRAAEELSSFPSYWSPAALALVSLDLPGDLSLYYKQPLVPLDKGIRQKVAQAYENISRNIPFTHPNFDAAQILDPEMVSSIVLPQAGLLALALRERYRLLGSWDGLKDDLEGIENFNSLQWKAPIACLVGLIPNPQDLLAELITNRSKSHVNSDAIFSFDFISLAVHGLLSSTLSPENLLKQVYKLLEMAKPGVQRTFINLLILKRPDLTAAIRQWLFAQPQPLAKELLDNPEVDQIENLLTIAHQAEIFRNLGELGESLRFYDEALRIAHQIQLDFSAAWANVATTAIKDPESSNNLNQADITAFFKSLSNYETSIHNWDSDPTHQLFFSQNLIHAGDPAEIRRWTSILENGQSTEAEPIPQSILISLAKHFENSGEVKLARSLTLKLTKNFQDVDAFNLETNWLGYFYGTESRSDLEVKLNTLEILEQLDLPREQLAILRIVLRDRPNNVDLIRKYGKSLRINNIQDEAIVVLTTASLQFPSDKGIRRLLAESLEKQGAIEEALNQREVLLALYGEANIDDSDYLNDALDLASTAISCADNNRARELCQMVLEADIANWRAHTILGRILSLEGDSLNAVSSFQNAAQLAPDQAEPWLEMSLVYREKDQNDQAISTLQTALQAIPDSGDIHLALGKSLLENNALTSAASNLKKAHDLFSSTPPNVTELTMDHPFIQSADALGATYRRLGHLNDSKEVLESAVSLIEGLPLESFSVLLYNYAKSLLALGENELALPILAEIVETETESLQPHMDYGKVLLETGENSAEAIRIFLHITELAPDNLEARIFLAEAFEAGEQYSKAMQLYLDVMETPLYHQKSWQEKISFGLGRTSLAQGLHEQAVAALQDAVQVNPHNPDIHRKLADACWASNLPTEAWKAAQTSLELDPSNVDSIDWFAGHVVKLYTPISKDISSTDSSYLFNKIPQPTILNMNPEQLLDQALDSIENILAYGNIETKLLVKLGMLRAIKGDSKAAVDTLHQVINSPNAKIEDLKDTGDTLYHLQDLRGAILSLEHAKTIADRAPNKIDIELYKHLARAYLANDDISSAQHNIEFALKGASADIFLYLTLASIEIKSGNKLGALRVLENGLTHCSHQANQLVLHYWAAKIKQNKKQYKSALIHVETALEIISSSSLKLSTGIQETDFLNLAVELSRTLFDLQRAARYIEIHQKTIDAMSNSQNLTANEIDLLFAVVEIALDKAGHTQSEAWVQKLQKFVSTQRYSTARLLAIQSRMAFQKNDNIAAEETLKSCIEEIDDLDKTAWPVIHTIKPAWELSNLTFIDDWLPNKMTFIYLGAIDAAVEIRQWKRARDLADRSIKYDPDHPALNIALARVLTLSSEYQSMCDTLSIVTHKPLVGLDREAAFADLQSSLEKASKILWNPHEDTGNFQIDNKLIERTPAYQVINRWRCRGYATFPDFSISSKQVDVEPWQSFALEEEDYAAYIASLRKDPSKTPKHILDWDLFEGEALAHRSLETRIQVAFSVENDQPEMALRIALNLAEHNPITKNDQFAVLAYALLALIASRQGEDGIAREAIENALKIWPDEPIWHALAGNLYLKDAASSGSPDSSHHAIGHYQKAVEQQPTDVLHQVQLANAYLSTSSPKQIKLQRAISSLEEATLIIPSEPKIWFELARYYSQLQSASDLAVAAKLVGKALKFEDETNLSETNPDTRLLQAEIELKRRNYQEAYRLASTFRTLFPSHPDGVLLQVQALEKSKQSEKALDVLDQAADIVQNSKELQLKRAYLLGECKDPASKLSALKSLANKFPDDFDVLNDLVYTLSQTNATEEAIQVAQESIQKADPENDQHHLAGIHYLLGDLLRKIGQLDQSIHHLTQSIKYRENYVDAYLALGEVFQKQRQYRKAQKIFHQAIDAAPDDPRPYVNAAIAYKDGKDFHTAEDLLRKAVELAPQEVAIRKQLAAVIAINLVQNPSQTPTH